MFFGNRNIFSVSLLYVVLLCITLCSNIVLAQSLAADGQGSASSQSPVVQEGILSGSAAVNKSAAVVSPAKTSDEAKFDTSSVKTVVEDKDNKAGDLAVKAFSKTGDSEAGTSAVKTSAEAKDNAADTSPDKAAGEIKSDKSALTASKGDATIEEKPLNSAEALPLRVTAATKPAALETPQTLTPKPVINKIPVVKNKHIAKQARISVPPLHRFQQAMFSEWGKYKGYKEKKDWDGVEKTLENIFVKQMQAGMTSQRTLSAALILDAEHESMQNNYSGAVLLLKYAKKISSSYSLPYFASAKAAFLNNPIYVITWAKDLFIGLLKNLETFQGRVLLTRFIVLVFSLAVLVTFLVFAILQAVKKYSFILHDISEYFPSLLPSVKKLLAGVFVSLPIFTLSIFWIVSYEILLFFRYMSRRERAISIVFFLFIASAPYVLNFLAGSFILEGKPEFWILSSSIEKGWYPSIYGDMSSVINAFKDKNSPGASSARFVLALASKKGGDFDRANVIWDELASEGFEPYRVFVDYGNTYFAQKNFAKAAELYNKSLKYKAKPILPLYNLSQTYSSSFMGDEASKLYTDAMAIDIKKVESFDVMGKIPGFNTTVVDAYLPAKYFFDIARSLVGDFSKTSEFFSESLFRWVGLANYWLAALIFVVISFLWGSVARERLPRWCDKCGKVFCTECSSAVSEGVCNECFAAFYEKSKAHFRVKRILSMKIHNEKKSYISYGISMFLPGGGHIYEGELFLGLIVLFVSALFISGWFFQGLIFGAQVISLNMSGIVFFLLLIPFFAMYMLILWDIRLKTEI